MKNYNISRLPSMICIGYDGENNWRPQSFDCSPLLANHPNGTITLWLLPDGETQAFPVALERDGNTVVWTPLSEEMTARTGALQIVCTDGTDVGKSRVAMYRVDSSILPGAEHPAAVPSWATQTVERAEDAADRAEEAAESIDIDAIEAMIAQAIVDYLEEHPIQAPVQSVNGKTGVVVLGASDVGALPSDTPIPSAVTEQTVAGWGFTKNTGTYSKPSTGIPKSDLSQSVQTSLGKADTAVQPSAISGMATETWVENKGYQTAPFEIEVTQSGSTYSTTASAADILAHIDNCVLVEDGAVLQQVMHQVFGSYAVILFANNTSVNGYIANASFVVTIDGSNVSVDYYSADAQPELPSVTASDNGKVLGVVNGAWTTIPPANALVIDWNNKYANAYNDAKAAMQADGEVYLKIPNAASDPTQCTYLRANGWDNTYIVFGGFTAAYLPGEVLIFTYAHITDGLSNWFKWTTNFYYNPVLLKHLAPAYDSTATYSVGDYVTYGSDASQTSSIYRCTTAINTPEDWNSAHWTAVTVMDEVATSELPDKTSASTGDFLRLDAQKNPVWQAIPSAESNSFGGGS